MWAETHPTEAQAIAECAFATMTERIQRPRLYKVISDKIAAKLKMNESKLNE